MYVVIFICVFPILFFHPSDFPKPFSFFFRSSFFVFVISLFSVGSLIWFFSRCYVSHKLTSFFLSASLFSVLILSLLRVRWFFSLLSRLSSRCILLIFPSLRVPFFYELAFYPAVSSCPLSLSFLWRLSFFTCPIVTFTDVQDLVVLLLCILCFPT